MKSAAAPPDAIGECLIDALAAFAAARHDLPEMRILLTLLLVALVAPACLAAQQDSQAEIDYLLNYIEHSKCRFIRSGTEYGPEEAATHLRMKLSKAGGRVKTAEDFINGIASKSYLTGKPYQIKLPDGSLHSTGPWLKDALERERQKTR